MNTNPGIPSEVGIYSVAGHGDISQFEHSVSFFLLTNFADCSKIPDTYGFVPIYPSNNYLADELTNVWSVFSNTLESCRSQVDSILAAAGLETGNPGDPIDTNLIFYYQIIGTASKSHQGLYPYAEEMTPTEVSNMIESASNKTYYTNIEWSQGEIDALTAAAEVIQESLTTNYAGYLDEVITPSYPTNVVPVYVVNSYSKKSASGLTPAVHAFPTTGTFSDWGKLENGDILTVFYILNYFTGHAGMWNKDVKEKSYSNITKNGGNCVLSSIKTGVSYESYYSYSYENVYKQFMGIGTWIQVLNATRFNPYYPFMDNNLNVVSFTNQAKRKEVILAGEKYIGTPYPGHDRYGNWSLSQGKNWSFNKYDTSAIYCSQEVWLSWRDAVGFDLDKTAGTVVYQTTTVWVKKLVRVYINLFGWRILISEYWTWVPVSVVNAVPDTLVTPSDLNWSDKQYQKTKIKANWY